MQFNVKEGPADAQNPYAGPAFSWALVKADGGVICVSPCAFDTEKACRSQIAEAKKSMKGAMRCKVVTLDA